MSRRYGMGLLAVAASFVGLLIVSATCQSSPVDASSSGPSSSTGPTSFVAVKTGIPTLDAAPADVRTIIHCDVQTLNKSFDSMWELAVQNFGEKRLVASKEEYAKFIEKIDTLDIYLRKVSVGGHVPDFFVPTIVIHGKIDGKAFSDFLVKTGVTPEQITQSENGRYEIEGGLCFIDGKTASDADDDVLIMGFGSGAMKTNPLGAGVDQRIADFSPKIDTKATMWAIGGSNVASDQPNANGWIAEVYSLYPFSQTQSTVTMYASDRDVFTSQVAPLLDDSEDFTLGGYAKAFLKLCTSDVAETTATCKVVLDEEIVQQTIEGAASARNRKRAAAAVNLGKIAKALELYRDELNTSYPILPDSTTQDSGGFMIPESQITSQATSTSAPAK